MHAVHQRKQQRQRKRKKEKRKNKGRQKKKKTQRGKSKKKKLKSPVEAPCGGGESTPLSAQNSNIKPDKRNDN